MTVEFKSKSNFGRAMINGYSTHVLMERFVCGETIPEIVEDFKGLSAKDVEEAIRFEILYVYRKENDENG